MLAIGEFHAGVELWDWRAQRRIWSRDIPEVQRISFAPGRHDVCAESDSHTLYVLTAEDGFIQETIRGVRHAVMSPFAPLLFARSRKRLTVIDRRTDRRLLSAPGKSFAVLAACFTPGAVVVAETDGWLRAFSLSDGRELLNASDARWSGFMELGCVGATEQVVAWASLADDRKGPLGELVRLDLQAGTVSPIHSRPWDAAAPIHSGHAWVFSNGAVEHV